MFVSIFAAAHSPSWKWNPRGAGCSWAPRRYKGFITCWRVMRNQQRPSVMTCFTCVPSIFCLCLLVSAYHMLATLPPGNQVAQSVRAQQAATGEDEAMHANAAGLQGQLAAAISVLDLAGGGGQFDANGDLVIKAEHVQVKCACSCLFCCFEYFPKIDKCKLRHLFDS